MLRLISLTICVLSRPAEAETSVYVFGPDQSTVIKTGGFAGVHETYFITGRFRLNVDSDAGVASFEMVEATLTDAAGSVYGRSLNEVFNMTALAGTVIDETIIKFEGKTTDGTESDVRLKLTVGDDSTQLTGKISPPPNSADLFFYELDAVATRKYGGGTGGPSDPYLIYTAEQMNAIGAEPDDYWDMHFKLMANIDLSAYKGTDFNIIGAANEPFTGVFDGNGHVISNFSYASVDTDYIGLFGNIYRAYIKDLGLTNPDVDAGTGDVVGSLVGRQQDGSITNCYAKGGSVSGKQYIGGLVGRHNEHSTIANCYAACAVSGIDAVGGLAGYLFESTISNCHSVGRVSGNNHVGGLVGWNLFLSGRVYNSFWDTQVSGQQTSEAGTGRTTAQMQTQSTFTDAGWDFVGESVNGTEDIWSICEGTNYPRLAWQIVAGDFVCPEGITTDDFLFFLEHWLDDNCDSSNDYCQGTDLDQSGVVDENDLAIFLENWSAER